MSASQRSIAERNLDADESRHALLERAVFAAGVAVCADIGSDQLASTCTGVPCSATVPGKITR